MLLIDNLVDGHIVSLMFRCPNTNDRAYYSGPRMFSTGGGRGVRRV